ncbi:hypothetical protein DSUL_20113 [Desulfovibrionales bacterium]
MPFCAWFSGDKKDWLYKRNIALDNLYDMFFSLFMLDDDRAMVAIYSIVS